MNDENIRQEQIRLKSIVGREVSWEEAINSLNIFPDCQYNANDIYNHGADDLCFGYVTRSFYYLRNNYPYAINWETCRETFERSLFGGYFVNHGNFRTAFFISPREGQEYRVPNFIRDIESNRLHLHELTTFMRTNRGRMILIRPSSFWTSCQMRFSLFTILCRAGRNYFFNSIEDALMSYDYSRRTFAAINLFFQGRRNFTGYIVSWQNKWVGHFNNLHETQIHNLR